MYEHFLIDNAPVKSPVESEDGSPQVEHYEDPEFEGLWNAENFDEVNIEGNMRPVDINNPNEWEEV